MDEDIGDLEKIKDLAEELEGEYTIPLTSYFTPSFMREYTDFESLEDFSRESPWTVESQKDINEIPDGPFNEYVDEHTVFSDQDEMMEKADEVLTEELTL